MNWLEALDILGGNPRYRELCESVDPEVRDAWRLKIVRMASGNASPKYPPNLLQKVQSFGNAVIEHAKDGFKNVSDEIYEERMSICKSCEHFTEQQTCKLCTCRMQTKCQWASSECPLKKWLKVEH